MFFEPGMVYRDYWIETVLHTPFGEWALAQNEEKGKVYLQHVRLRKPAPPSLIDQYLSLDHPMLVPFWEVYQEPRALVFVRPCVDVDGLIYCCPTYEETAAQWCGQLAQLEDYLENQPIPMKIVYSLQNIGVTDQGELRVFLCGNPSHIRCDFSDRETLRRALIGEKGKWDQYLKFGKSKKLVWGTGIAFLLCFAAGFGAMHSMQKSDEKPIQSQAVSEAVLVPEQASEAALDPNISNDSAPPTLDDIEKSQLAAERFVFSLDQDDYQQILKKKARSMTVLPNMEAEQIDSGPGKIIWNIEAEVFHSDGNMKGEMYRTKFRVVTKKENGFWQVKNAEVTEEKKL